MALTKKDLLEAIEDMPMNTPIAKMMLALNSTTIAPIVNVECDKENNRIILC